MGQIWFSTLVYFVICIYISLKKYNVKYNLIAICSADTHDKYNNQSQIADYKTLLKLSKIWPDVFT